MTRIPTQTMSASDEIALPIKIWRYKDAPPEYQLENDDSDWVAFIQSSYEDDYIGFLNSGSSFGCCDVYEFEVEDGIVKIGYHA